MIDIRLLWLELKDQYQRGGIKALIESSIEGIFINLCKKQPRLYNRISHPYYRWRSSNDIYNYIHPPNPFKINFTSPNRISYWTNRDDPYFCRRKSFGKVLNGDWDQPDQNFDESVFHQSMIAHFEDGVYWKDTEFIQWRLELLQQGTNDPQRYKSREDIFNECEKWDKLYKNIKKNGYKTQTEILDDEYYNSGLFLDELDEVTVDIGRNGELLFVDGMHRLSFAKILNIDAIPVVFLVRHKEWMEYRDELCKNNEPIPDHPDLRDLK